MPERLEEVAIVIAGQRWRAWTDVEIERSSGAFSSVRFTAAFDPDRREFRQTFQPFTFKTLDVYVEDSRIFAGRLVGIDPQVSRDERTVQCSAYSLPAVLNDVTMPASAFPLELRGLKLSRIAETLVEPFGLTVRMDADDGAPFRQVTIQPEDRIHGFLTELAKQRGLVITDSEFGTLVFQTSATPGQPVARLREGEDSLTAITPTFSPQAYFSEMTGIAKTRAGSSGGQYTVQNPRLDVLRPSTITLDDCEAADVPAAVRARMGRMFGNMVAVGLDVPTWRTPAGALWEPKTTVTLRASGAMIYRETEFLIRDVILRQNAEVQSATLKLALPGAFSGEIPESLPWD